jgi:hypothetical protein
MKPIPEWRDAWRLWSVRFTLLLLVWELMPEHHQTALLSLIGVPADLIPGVLAALILAARLIAQPALHQEDEK